MNTLADRLDAYDTWKHRKTKLPITHFVSIQGVRVPALTSADLRFIASCLKK